MATMRGCLVHDIKDRIVEQMEEMLKDVRAGKVTGVVALGFNEKGEVRMLAVGRIDLDDLAGGLDAAWDMIVDDTEGGTQGQKVVH